MIFTFTFFQDMLSKLVSWIILFALFEIIVYINVHYFYFYNISMENLAIYCNLLSITYILFFLKNEKLHNFLYKIMCNVRWSLSCLVHVLVLLWNFLPSQLYVSVYIFQSSLLRRVGWKLLLARKCLLGETQ